MSCSGVPIRGSNVSVLSNGIDCLEGLIIVAWVGAIDDSRQAKIGPMSFRDQNQCKNESEEEGERPDL